MRVEGPEHRDSAGAAGAVVVPYPDGPLLLRGSFTITDTDGREIVPDRGTVALCRCGRSALKPFCDGSHRGLFRAPSGDQRTTRGRASEPADTVRGDGESLVAVPDPSGEHALGDREPRAD
jgi:CDGSH-type Zn-finger protein